MLFLLMNGVSVVVVVFVWLGVVILVNSGNVIVVLVKLFVWLVLRL